LADRRESGPVPSALRATTVQRYAVPLLSRFTVSVVLLPELERALPAPTGVHVAR
jgi:hypothetical protein